MNVPSSINNDPIQEAQHHWDNETAAFLVFGDVYTQEPIIDVSGFYLACSWKGQDFVNDYNRRIKELVKEHGMPEWAPGHRVIPQEMLLDKLATGGPLNLFAPRSTKDRKLVKGHTRLWQEQLGRIPEVFAQCDSRQIVLVAGTFNNSIRIDQLDIRCGYWMATDTLHDMALPKL